MKPRIFIGSSVEGLNLAYAIQQNLTYDAEITVWDQGVFELSKTSIESLNNILDKSDYGIFVFNPDDILKIRNEEVNSVRDNVIFETGLFIGKLSRERVFFLKPMKGELHIPTDLLGLTPGTYDSEREDNSLQAASGPFCNQVRQTIKKLGRLTNDDEISKTPEKDDKQIEKDYKWFFDFHQKKYKDAITKLKKLIKSEKNTDEILKLELWKIHCEFKINEKKGIELLTEYLTKNKSVSAFKGVARIYQWEDYIEKSNETISEGLKKHKDNLDLVVKYSDNIVKYKTKEEAVEYLMKFNPKTNIEIALKLCEIFNEEKEYSEAKIVIHNIYSNFPNNESIKYKYARIAIELEENEIAIFLLDSLTKEFPKNTNYWGYLSNTALQLDFYDLALSSNRKAEELSESKIEWILSNIGNTLKNKGFYSEGIKYLEKGLEINPKSDYAHDRLSISIKEREKEREDIKLKCKEGRKLIRNFEQE